MAQIVGYPGGFAIGSTATRTNTTGIPPVPLGTVGYDAAGAEYRYIRAGGAIAVGTVVIPTASATPYDAVVVSSAANQLVLGGCVDAAFATNDCGWILRAGPLVSVTGGTLTAGTNKTTAAAGALADAAAADLNNACGIMLVASPALLFVQGL